MEEKIRAKTRKVLATRKKKFVYKRPATTTVKRWMVKYLPYAEPSSYEAAPSDVDMVHGFINAHFGKYNTGEYSFGVDLWGNEKSEDAVDIALDDDDYYFPIAREVIEEQREVWSKLKKFQS